MTLIEWTVCHIQIACIIQQFLVTVPYSHIVLCLDNRASAWHWRSVTVCGHSSLQQSLTVAFQKATAWVAGASLFQTSKIWRVFTDARREQGAAWKRFIVYFPIISKQRCGHKGVACFKGWQKVPVHVEHSGTKQLKQCTDKDSAVSLTCIHHHQTHGAETRQTACVRR